MQRLKVDCVVTSPGRSHVTFWVDRDVRVVALVSKERRDSGSSTWCVVVCKLRQWE